MATIPLAGSSTAKEVFYAKIWEEGLFEAIEEIMHASGQFENNWPRDLPKCIRNRIANATIFKNANKHCLSRLAEDIGPPRGEIRIFDCSNMAFIVVNDALRAITFTDLLKHPEGSELVMISPDAGLSWTSLCDLAR